MKLFFNNISQHISLAVLLLTFYDDITLTDCNIGTTQKLPDVSLTVRHR